MNRKEFLKMMGAGAVLPFAGCYTANMMPQARNAHLNLGRVFGPVGPKGEYHVFSKMFQFLDYDHCAELLAKAGATGIEWTIRKGGHIDPAKLATDLPKAVEAARKQGLKSEMAVVSYTSPDDAGAEATLKAMADQGFRQFRPGYYFYGKGETPAQTADRVKASLAKWAAFCEKTGLKAVHQNHSACGKNAMFGSLIWDMWDVMKDLDPRFVAFEYDPMHAMCETGVAFTHAFEKVLPHVGAICLKDFHFKMDKDNKHWAKQLCAAGEGIVPWKTVKEIAEKGQVRGPYVLHFEWDFPKEDLVKTVKTEIDFFKGVFG